MSGLRLLLLTQSFDPDRAAELLTFAKHLRALGYDITVHTGSIDYRDGKLCGGYRTLPWQAQRIDGIRVLLVPLRPSRNGSAIRRMANDTSFALALSIAAMAIPKPDVAYVYHLPTTVALAATALKWLRNVPFVYGAPAVLPGSCTAPGSLSQRRMLHADRCATGFAYRQASRVVVPSDRLRRRLVEQDRAEEHIAVVPDAAADDESLAPTTPGATTLDRVLREAIVLRPWTLAAKRAGDIVAACTLLTLSAVPMLVIAAVVRTKLGTSAVFRQQRPGRFGRPFTILKFRTMTDARDGSGDLLPDADRLTPLGSFLRRSSLDELPSLINVVKGDMSLVGPRPLLTRYTEWFTIEERQRLHVRPGITGLAQVRGRNFASWADRLEDDVDYVRRLTIARDIRILLATARQVLRRAGAVADPESIMSNLDDERRRQGSGS